MEAMDPNYILGQNTLNVTDYITITEACDVWTLYDKVSASSLHQFFLLRNATLQMKVNFLCSNAYYQPNTKLFVLLLVI
jgi:hypothetical protein